MAFVQFDFYAKTIGVETSMNIILPQRKGDEEPGRSYLFQGDFPVLFLLHGLSDDHTAWMRKTSIERYVNELGLAVVMPAVHRSFYTDMKYGYSYWSFISEELPRLVRRYFPLSEKREDNFVAGLSMGGYGAFKLALRCPHKFAAAASLSGALDIVRIAEEEEDREEELGLIFGDKDSMQNSKNDLCYLLQEKASQKHKLPRLYQCCGRDDFLYEDNLHFKKLADEQGIDILFEDDPDEEHTWSYWDRKIERVLKWLPLQR